MSNRQRTPEELAFNTTVGSNIKYLRKTRNLNQSKVAVALSVSFQQIQKYEKGANGCSAIRLKQLAEFFKVGLDELYSKEGIDFNIKSKGSNLSAGQRQRLLIARALYKKPKLLILDEPTSNLDIKTESQINSLITSLKTEMTIIMISHSSSIFKDADQVYDVMDGKAVKIK